MTRRSDSEDTPLDYPKLHHYPRHEMGYVGGAGNSAQVQVGYRDSPMVSGEVMR